MAKKTKAKATKTTTTKSPSSGGLVGKRFTVLADSHGTAKYQGHVNAEVAPGIFMVEVDDKLHLVPLTSMTSGSLEVGTGSWVFE